MTAIPYDMIRAHLGTAVPFANTIGVALTALGDGTGTATLAQSEATSNHIGTQHAGAMFTLGEAASGAAVAGALAPVILQSRPLAKDARIVYTKIAKGLLTAHATTSRPGTELLSELEGQGKTVFDVSVSIIDADGETVCEMMIAWHVRLAR